MQKQNFGLVLPPIPWRHADFELGEVWRWSTSHFIVTVTGDERSFFWRIVDISARKEEILEEHQLDTPFGDNSKTSPFMLEDEDEEDEDDFVDEEANGVMFAEGRSASFAAAENQIRETIGKAYGPRLGYQKWSGDLANTFVIATGEKQNFTPYLGAQVKVTVTTRTGYQEDHYGILRVQHYDITLETETGILKIPPTFIIKISNPYVKERQAGGGGIGRTYKGVLTQGCSGTPGFFPGTIEHRGGLCPIHEEI